MKFKFLTARKVSLIVSNVFVFFFGIVTIGKDICFDNFDAISTALNQPTTKTIAGDDKGRFYYLPTVWSIAELKVKTGKAIENVSNEGVTLLKNENNALPLKSGDKVSLYSSSSVNYIYSGGGSSYAKASRPESVTLKAGLEGAGLVVNEHLWNFYSSNTSYNNNITSSTSSDGCKYDIKDANWEQITAGRDETAEAGIFVLSRYGTEASDLAYTGAAATLNYSNGDYLELSPAEISVLKGMKALKDQGKLKKIAVLLNSVAQVELNYKDNAEYGIDAILWVGEGGTTGTKAIGKILTGKVNPSGKLPDTYFNSHAYNPVYANFGGYSYSGSSVGSGKSSYATVYQEGIYNGYRYVETRYFDKQVNRDRVGDFDYDKVVAYPFGFGLSYTTFSYSDFKVSYNSTKDEYTLSTKVTNTGNVAGKESVQFYLNKPYTDYDITNHVEKAAVDFVGYAKTKELAKGASETVYCVVPREYLASYDSYGAKTYIVDKGDYYFTVGKNAHDATNNVLKARNQVGNGDASKTNKVSVDKFDDKTYAVSKVTGEAITNQFDNADLNLHPNKGTNRVTYITRNDWEGTVKFGMTEDHAKTDNHVPVTITAEMQYESKKLADRAADLEQYKSEDYPLYSQESNMTLASLLSYDENENLIHVEYNDPRWEELLNKISWDETVMFISNALRQTSAIASIGKAVTIDGNGAVGPVGSQNNKYSDINNVALNRFALSLDDPDKNQCPYQYPTHTLVAATMSDEVANELGDAIGEDCLWCGYSGLYGLGVNLHRSMYSGRMFEYYSEDGVLSGKLATAETRAIRKRGVYVYMKHAILNEQEKYREGICTFANEQSIRELYCKAYEIPIREAGAENLMTSFNRIGTIWSGQQGFVNNVFRKEFGMQGFAVSDYWQNGYMDLLGGLMNGNALPDGSRASSASASALYKYGPGNGYGKIAWTMREEMHRILYIVVNSNAMNGVSASGRVIQITPPWVTILNTSTVVVTVLFALSLACLVGSGGMVEFNKFKRKED